MGHHEYHHEYHAEWVSWVIMSIIMSIMQNEYDGSSWVSSWVSCRMNMMGHHEYHHEYHAEWVWWVIMSIIMSIMQNEYHAEWVSCRMSIMGHHEYHTQSMRCKMQSCIFISGCSFKDEVRWMHKYELCSSHVRAVQSWATLGAMEIKEQMCARPFLLAETVHLRTDDAYATSTAQVTNVGAQLKLINLR